MKVKGPATVSVLGWGRGMDDGGRFVSESKSGTCGLNKPQAGGSNSDKRHYHQPVGRVIHLRFSGSVQLVLFMKIGEKWESEHLYTGSLSTILMHSTSIIS